METDDDKCGFCGGSGSAPLTGGTCPDCDGTGKVRKPTGPMTDEEWRAFGSTTLYGPPPWPTLMRIFATVGRVMEERDAARKKIADAEEVFLGADIWEQEPVGSHRSLPVMARDVAEGFAKTKKWWRAAVDDLLAERKRADEAEAKVIPERNCSCGAVRRGDEAEEKLDRIRKALATEEPDQALMQIALIVGT